jgi:thiol:disulfide interchange protein DsbA
MYKRLKSPWLGMIAVAVLFSANTQAFDEGIDYKTLPKPIATETGDKIEVLELFWYGCPHCFHLEPAIQNWLSSKPENVEFRRSATVLGPHWAIHGKVFFAAEILGVLDQVHEPFFDALHNKKQALSDDDSIADWMEKHGVDRDEFLKAYKSFIVDMKVRRSMQISRQIGLDGVPAFVVNGKYLTSPSQTGGSTQMFKVIDHLIAVESGNVPNTEQVSSVEPPERIPERAAGAAKTTGSSPADTVPRVPTPSSAGAEQQQ